MRVLIHIIFNIICIMRNLDIAVVVTAVTVLAAIFAAISSPDLFDSESVT